MSSIPSIAVRTATLAVAFFSGTTSYAPAQDAARPHKSVYGTLERVDDSQNSVVMKSDSGERLAWRFEPAVIAEAARFKPGAKVIVIYRQISATEKRVTALAFPDAAAKPTYVNLTRESVVLRSAPASGGSCEQPTAGPVSESTIPPGGRAEALEACWCCALAGGACSTATKAGAGKALLVQCF